MALPSEARLQQPPGTPAALLLVHKPLPPQLFPVQLSQIPSPVPGWDFQGFYSFLSIVFRNPTWSYTQQRFPEQ